ncbi:MAG: hypothetical protein UR69_C0001G0290 [Candidatus Moranbacteria bacterium GW2011_GWE2_35_2-]|nr:MAG: hypothetical protein UR69_C0001G0290 [Candidatus Moranbacteria bacterium GW2011_GWE2_35_2-]KKQ21819.1 MAG: hypothetical protein US37_C0007G0017 [Candidatus Moranbacteria bacterium GW2011_GWF2_37_11]KKQ28866.1 MAG: hypothetical protein US44_C0005G0008 [Candidatus Moranbacteria bacterium GW2011_GWD1_37_17]KKQ31057.1 MAG: hypothetical protein US47_C0001G0290 [Candidatus Moranbacteria bacterium GW2011_GWE1_37_24]KKQ48120.1 MAG: hypothetical protein US66_C0002G0064 [Candidatus Moranbacteria 
MQKEIFKINAALLIFIFGMFVANNAQAQVWQETLESNFDIAESFDQLEDWKGLWANGGIGNIVGEIPKYLDGTNSLWNYYSDWCPEDPATNWIDDFGEGNRIGDSGKSLIIDMGCGGENGEVKGPSRFGMYFGNGTKESGYEDISLFFMTKLPKNMWPTHCIDSVTREEVSCATYRPLGAYEENREYIYYESFKFGTLNMGCFDALHCLETPEEEYSYSPYHIIPHIKKYNYEPINGGLVLKNEPNDPDGLGRTGFYGIAEDRTVITDDWMGVEFRFKNVMENGVQKTYMDIWIYDKVGNSWHVLVNTPVDFVTQDITELWNWYFFGGNNSGGWLWGDSMQSWYYVDDFIIDDGSKGQIGPRYFSLLNSVVGDNIPPSRSAGLPTGTLIAGTTSTVFSLITNESAVCKYSGVSGTTYETMTGTFATTGTTSHSTILSGLTNGNSYNYYVRCSDMSNNVNIDDYEISFSIKPAPITYTLTNFISAITNWLGIGNETSDVNSDGVVNTRDLGVMMSNWGN